jgi:hypothetical protein
VAKLVEAMVLSAGIKLLSRIGQDARRRVLAYWCACAESLPLMDGNGKILDEHPMIEKEPPLIQFMHERHDEPAAQPDA